MELSTQIYLIAVLVLLLTVIVGVYPNFFEIYEKSSKKINAPSLITYFILILVLIILMMFQSGLNDQVITSKDEKIDSLQAKYAHAFQLKQDSSTNAIQNGISEGNRKTYDTLAFAFKKQGIDFDSLQLINRKSLEKNNALLVDSLSKVTEKNKINSVNKPVFEILAYDQERKLSPLYLDVDNGKSILKVRMESKNNTSYNVKINYFLVSCKNVGDSFAVKKRREFLDSGYLFEHKILTQDRISTPFFNIRPELSDLDCVLVIMLGTYSSDIDNFLKYDFADIVRYDIKNNKMIEFMDDKLSNTIIKMYKIRPF